MNLPADSENLRSWKEMKETTYPSEGCGKSSSIGLIHSDASVRRRSIPVSTSANNFVVEVVERYQFDIVVHH